METRTTIEPQVSEATLYHNKYYNRHFFSQGLTTYDKEDVPNKRHQMDRWIGRFNRFTRDSTELRTRPGFTGFSTEKTAQWLGTNPAKYLR
jgi:hypothetical protein